MHGHLVAVKVRVVRGADQRMNADGRTFDEHRLKRLHGQTVQRGRTVQHHRVALGHLFQHVPHLGRLALDKFFGRTHGMHVTQFLETANDERLEQHERHLLGQTALVELQFRSDNDHRTAGIIHTLAEQVLAETPTLSLEHVGQRLERAVTRAGYRTAVPSVVEQRVHRFLQHPFLVANDDLGGLQLHEIFQTVVPVDHTAVQVVQVRRRKAPTFQGHEWPQVRRNHRQHTEDHPFRACGRFLEAVE